MTRVDRDGEVALDAPRLERARLEQQLQEMERPPRGESRLAWLLIVLGLVTVVGLSAHAYSAYSTIARIDVTARIATANPLALFQDVATNGPRLGSTVDSASRRTYTQALEQFVLDGTGVGVGVALVLSGFFIRLNH
jgi:hypothetical protein